MASAISRNGTPSSGANLAGDETTPEKNLNRRQLLLASTTLFATARQAVGQTWPARPLRFVVPFAAGAGILDIMARIVGQHLTDKVSRG